MPTIIAIAGGSNSGKTTLAKLLLQHYKEAECLILSFDDYYRAQTHLTMEERKKTNYDHPNSLDTELFFEHLNALKAGQEINMPLYDYILHDRKAETKRIAPKPIIIVEGILTLYPEKLRELYECAIFVNAESAIAKERRIKRDTEERGRTKADAIEQYETTVLPMYLEFVAPTKDHAHVIVDNSVNHPTLNFNISDVIAFIDKTRATSSAQRQYSSSAVVLTFFGRTPNNNTEKTATSSATLITTTPAFQN